MKNQQHYMPGVLICGIVAGLLTGIPCVNILMCCFCIQVVGPAMFGVKLVADKSGTTIEAGEAAVIGVIVGGVAALLGGILMSIVDLVGGAAMNQAQMAQLAQQFPQLAPMLAQQGAAGPVGAIASRFCCFIIMLPIFGALGGLIGAVVFKKDPPIGGGGGGGYEQPPQGGYQQPQTFENPQGGYGQPPQGGGYGQPPQGGGGFGPG